jgi:hypothetical protein
LLNFNNTKKIDWKKKKRKNRSSETHGIITKDSMVLPSESQKKRRKNMGVKENLKRFCLKIFQTQQRTKNYKFKKLGNP